MLDIKTRPSTGNSNNLLPCISDAYEDSPQSQCEGVSFSSYPLMSESNKNDFASLVSMLVIRLLKKVDSLRQDIGTHQDGLPDDMLDMFKELIQMIPSEPNTAFGITGGESFPQDVNFHQIYRNVYRELIQEFGCKNMLRSALESQDLSLEMSLVEKLTKEITKTCSQTSIPTSAKLPSIQAVAGLQGNNKEKENVFISAEIANIQVS